MWSVQWSGMVLWWSVVSLSYTIVHYIRDNPVIGLWSVHFICILMILWAVCDQSLKFGIPWWLKCSVVGKKTYMIKPSLKAHYHCSSFFFGDVHQAQNLRSILTLSCLNHCHGSLLVLSLFGYLELCWMDAANMNCKQKNVRKLILFLLNLDWSDFIFGISSIKLETSFSFISSSLALYIMWNHSASIYVWQLSKATLKKSMRSFKSMPKENTFTITIELQPPLSFDQVKNIVFLPL